MREDRMIPFRYPALRDELSELVRESAQRIIRINFEGGAGWYSPGIGGTCREHRIPASPMASLVICMAQLFFVCYSIGIRLCLTPVLAVSEIVDNHISKIRPPCILYILS